jgi:hypothetical protein
VDEKESSKQILESLLNEWSTGGSVVNNTYGFFFILFFVFYCFWFL